MRSAALLILLWLAGCGGGADSKLQDIEKHVQSWSATMQLTSAQYADGSVTRAYVRQVIKAADDDLQQQRKTLAGLPDQPRRRELTARLDRVDEQTRSLAARATETSGR